MYKTTSQWHKEGEIQLRLGGKSGVRLKAAILWCVPLQPVFSCSRCLQSIRKASSPLVVVGRGVAGNGVCPGHGIFERNKARSDEEQVNPAISFPFQKGWGQDCDMKYLVSHLFQE